MDNKITDANKNDSHRMAIDDVSSKPKEKITSKIKNSNVLVENGIKSKFQATLLGALIGDCLGRDLEGTSNPNMSLFLKNIDNAKNKLEKEDSKSVLYKSETYTDDTALTNAICESLISKTSFNLISIAKSFVRAYTKEPNRGYASGAVELFKQMHGLYEEKTFDDYCFYPSFNLFNGQGSRGNGGGMRCSPIPLFTYSKSLDEMNIISKLITSLTHSNKEAIIGTQMLCFAIRTALKTKENDFDHDIFFNSIQSYVSLIEHSFNDYNDFVYYNKKELNISDSSFKQFLIYYDQQSKFQVQKNLNQKYSNILKELYEIIRDCRNGKIIDLKKFYENVCKCSVEALESIPVSFLAFMIASDPRCENEVNSKLKCENAFEKFKGIERVIFYSMSFGGDVDTISSMAGSLAGAFYSMNEMPPYLYKLCETYEKTLDNANNLYDINLRPLVESTLV